jgi:MFS family permease
MDRHSVGGQRIGWLMIASMLVDAWDLYAISLLVVFLKPIYHPSDLLLGLASAAPQAGAIIGALIGGWVTDKIGRRAVFLSTMVMFIVFALAQAFSPNMVVLAVIRFILGIPLGSDIANGYTYIMEYVRRDRREVVGNSWQIMFTVGSLLSGAVVVMMLVIGIDTNVLWRVALALGAVPAAILFVLRFNLPETAIYLIQRGKYAQAKQLAQRMYGDSLDMLPDADIQLPQVRLRRFLAEIWRDPQVRRPSMFGWGASIMQSLESATSVFLPPDDLGAHWGDGHAPRRRDRSPHRCCGNDLRDCRAADHSSARPAQVEHVGIRHNRGFAYRRRHRNPRQCRYTRANCSRRDILGPPLGRRECDDNPCSGRPGILSGNSNRFRLHLH